MMKYKRTNKQQHVTTSIFMRLTRAECALFLLLLRLNACLLAPRMAIKYKFACIQRVLNQCNSITLAKFYWE